jgi:hypothetical protein
MKEVNSKLHNIQIKEKQTNEDRQLKDILKRLKTNLEQQETVSKQIETKSSQSLHKRLANLQGQENGIRSELQKKEEEILQKEQVEKEQLEKQQLQTKLLLEARVQAEEQAKKQAIKQAKSKEQIEQERQIEVIEEHIKKIVTNIVRNKQFINGLVEGNSETINKTDLQQLLKVFPSENKSKLDLDLKLSELRNLPFFCKYEQRLTQLGNHTAYYRNLSKKNLDKIYYLFCKYNKLSLGPRTIQLSELGTFINSDRIFDIDNYIKVKIYQDAIFKINEHALFMLSFIQGYIARGVINSVYLYDSSNILYGKKPNKENINSLLIDYIKKDTKSNYKNSNIFRLGVYHNSGLDYNNLHHLVSLSDSDQDMIRFHISAYIITIPTRLYDDSIKTTYELDDVFILLLTHHLTTHHIPVTICSNDGYSPKRYNNICVNKNDYIPCQSDVLSAIRFVIPDILTNIVSNDGSFKGKVRNDDLSHQARSRSGGRESNKQTLFLNHCY